MPSITINLGEQVQKVLAQRAKKNMLSLREQAEDIIRRSCVMSRIMSSPESIKCDDKLVGIFSRERRGRKKRKPQKKKR